MMPESETSEDAVLGGRLRLRQPLKGHRVGHDAILLAAATGAKSGEHAVDLGAGVGAAGLALASRVAGLNVTLVEIDPLLCRLAANNVKLNRLDDRVRALKSDIAHVSAHLAEGSTDRVLMNPPFNDPARQNVSPDARRRLAHVAAEDTLGTWTGAAARLLRADGTLTLIWRADGLSDVLAALAKDFGAAAVLPVHPRAGAPAIRVLVRATKGGKALRKDYPELCLNDASGRPSEAAEAVLRGGETLILAAL
ncbi:MAG: tRNA1(Val) (adenine(37)-N6)-methyltransferase [Xanthobacteraceae bacterium]